MLHIETARLRLLPCTEEIAHMAVANRAALDRRLDVQVPPEWPTADLRDLLPLYAAQLAADPGCFGWGVWLMIERTSHTLIGDIGFKGPPDEHGLIEIGYGVLPTFQRRGYATEAAQGLINWARTQPQVRRVIAECLADNTPSIRVLERLGMRRLPPETEMLKWELPPAPDESSSFV
jgi:[ribosomal protein S5]-alanine N-acetyltransferase